MLRILFVCLILNCFEKQTVEVYRKESFFQEINVSKVQGTSSKNILPTNQKHIGKCLLSTPSETSILFLFAGKLKNLLYLGKAQPSAWPSPRFLVPYMVLWYTQLAHLTLFHHIYFKCKMYLLTVPLLSCSCSPHPISLHILPPPALEIVSKTKNKVEEKMAISVPAPEWHLARSHQADNWSLECVFARLI